MTRVWRRATDIRAGYLVEGSVAQAAQLHQVGQAEDPVLDDEAHQLGEGLQQALEDQGQQEVTG